MPVLSETLACLIPNVENDLALLPVASRHKDLWPRPVTGMLGPRPVTAMLEPRPVTSMLGPGPVTAKLGPRPVTAKLGLPNTLCFKAASQFLFFPRWFPSPSWLSCLPDRNYLVLVSG